MAYQSSNLANPIYKSNCGWPLQRAQNGWKRATVAARAESALRHLLITPKGSYYVDPNYGTVLYRYRTQNVSTTVEAIILADVKHAARLYMPDVTVHTMEITRDSVNQKLTFTFVWTLNGGDKMPWVPQLASAKKLAVAF